MHPSNLQLHQGDKPFDGSTDGQVRRNRRGRPKKSDYFFTCEERCKMCGGGWVIDNGRTDPSVATNDFAAEARRKMERDEAARDLEQRTMLFRCKGCQVSGNIFGEHIVITQPTPCPGRVSPRVHDQIRQGGG